MKFAVPEWYRSAERLADLDAALQRSIIAPPKPPPEPKPRGAIIGPEEAAQRLPIGANGLLVATSLLHEVHVETTVRGLLGQPDLCPEGPHR